MFCDDDFDLVFNDDNTYNDTGSATSITDMQNNLDILETSSLQI